MSLATIQLEDPKAAYCIKRTLPLEGGLVDNPADPGGVTSCGVSLRWALAEVKAHPDTARFLDLDHDGHVSRKDIEGLTSDEAADIYYQCWWRPGWYGNLIPDAVAWKCFDIAVNAGPKRAAVILQKALVALDHALPVDQVIGPRTVLAVKAENDKDDGNLLLFQIRVGQTAFYRGLVAKEPKLKRFLSGWLNRAAA